MGRGAIDARSVKVRAPIQPDQKVSFISILENIEMSLNANQLELLGMQELEQWLLRMRVTPAAVTHGSLTVRVSEDPQIVQQMQLLLRMALLLPHLARQNRSRILK